MTSRGEPRQVLIVDDNVALAENIAEVLQIDGHVTRVAASAEDGATMAYESRPDVIVTDYRLPGLSGADFLKKLREIWIPVHPIVMSGHTDERTLKAAKDAGASFMAKPVDLTLLSRWVRQGSASE
jgi:DNA-binding NtrC family response regulator